MSKSKNVVSYHLLKNASEPSQQTDDEKVSIAEEDSAEQSEETTGKSSLWKAVVNLMTEMEGTGLLGLPYVIAYTGLAAVAALLVIPFVTFYTGAILIDCLYDKDHAGERVRIRSNYKELGEACWPRFGGAIVAAVQVIELILLASLYLVLFASLSSSIFPGVPLSDKVWMLIAAVIGLPTIFLKNLSQVAWLSLLSVVALLVAVIAVLAVGISHHSSWDIKDLLVWNITEMPVALGIIIFSYISHPVLPSVEASMENRSQFNTMLAYSYTSVAILKVAFSVCAFLSFSSNIQEVIVNSLPMGVIRILVNGFLILNVFFSYPFLVITIIQTFEESVTTDSFPFKIPDLVWFIGIRLLTNFLILLPAISIPHYALFMAFIGSFTASFLALILPPIFHLILKKEVLKFYHYVFDISIIFIGILASLFGLYFSGKSLVRIYTSN